MAKRPLGPRRVVEADGAPEVEAGPDLKPGRHGARAEPDPAEEARTGSGFAWREPGGRDVGDVRR